MNKQMAKPLADTRSTLQSYRQQVMPIVHAIRDYAKAAAQYCRRLIDEYPPLKVRYFILTFAYE